MVNTEKFISQSIAEIRNAAGNEKGGYGPVGGVSTVRSALLLQPAPSATT